MAKASGLSDQVDTDLCAIAAELEFLPEMGEFWPEEPEGSRVSYSLEWDELMRRLIHLSHLERSEKLSPDQTRRLHALLRTFQALTPTIERLGLYRPAIGATFTKDCR
ncbi:MAG TPA: hypothetical protein VFU72_13130 [Nitrolancea sp.]|nr:hypothetical protein [Nitrolancea sp.]